MKFGGTSVAGTDELKRAARRIVAAREQGQRVVAVLSARGKSTDRLLEAAARSRRGPIRARWTCCCRSASVKSCALCAMAINDLGHRAISLTGSQAGIVTDSSHTKARIIDVRPTGSGRPGGGLDSAGRRLPGRLDRQPRRHHAGPGRVRHDRGGTRRRPRRRGLRDLHRRRRRLHRRPADRPRRRKLPVVSYEEMLEMASSGAKVLQLRRSNMPGTTESGSTVGARRTKPQVPSSSRSRRPWNDPRNRSHPLDRRGTGHAHRRARRARSRRSDLRRARRRQHQRRHDHPE